MLITRLTTAFAAAVVGLAVLWGLSLEPDAFTGGFWATRHTLVYGTGVMALGLMSIGVILAARPVWFETALGGLDKFYRLHKWLGIAALGFATAHWLLRKGPSWISDLGLFAIPPKPRHGDEIATGFDLFRDLKHPAAEIGEWAFYALVALVAIALWKRFPYKYFFVTHRLMPVVYLVLIFHAVILVDRSYWTKPLGPVLALLLAAGSVAALTALFRRIGSSRQASGTIATLSLYEGNQVLDVGVRLDTAWPGHKAGQFAFVNFDDAEAAHPFTISSAWQNDGLLQFTIKGLGDYTRTLASQLHVGQSVVVEGPYGRFNFQDNGVRQIWIGGGVGITPFIARLRQLALAGRSSPIDLFYATDMPDAAFIVPIRELAQQTGIAFHLVDGSHADRLTLEKLAATVPEWKQADVWFCGPSGFGDAMRSTMIAQGLPASRFHQELFEMR
ncbi:ferric reductase-like transmembrane domain-containing protein [Rhodopseudomonas pseudopalustris]|uniref:ferredoxin reductase family protein n=1 Tax=Rhodopseudomonas pseudopalustris TaxID=1513892 RepID=UPI003F9B2D9C